MKYTKLNKSYLEKTMTEEYYFNDCVNCTIRADVLNTDNLEVSGSSVGVLNIYYTGDIMTEVFQLLTQNQVHDVRVTVSSVGTITDIQVNP